MTAFTILFTTAIGVSTAVYLAVLGLAWLELREGIAYRNELKDRITKILDDKQTVATLPEDN